ncbi:MAG: 30S ribosomal protein S5 [Sphaerochaetaceae bacterium]|nr:30S ribosomal protein S5 [Spirochaetales bacterium]MDY3768173.1 30S ribosomal protein S5 [Sphaerochaetaceae bacterium]MDY5968002.1 30S ribosomal protein S5 [Sphaerochaetaceae bacterium]
MAKREKAQRDNREHEERKEDKYVEKLIAMNRVSKSTKGGRTISFAALMVVGDKNGNVGFALGKANDVSEAIKKATLKAQKSMRNISLKRVSSPNGEVVNVTIPHEIIGKFKSAEVVLRPATPGTGIIAGGPVRALCDAVGITDILSKSLGANNKSNVIKATLDGFSKLYSPDCIAKGRDKRIKDMWG